LAFAGPRRTAFASVSDLKARGPEATLDLRVVSSRLIRTRRRGLTIFTAVLAVISMGTSFYFAAKVGGFGEGKSDSSLMMTISTKAVVAVFVMALPVAVLFSAALLTIALFAKSYKEAQSYVSPMMFIVIIPAVCAMLPIDLDAKLALVPILNASLLCKELVTDTYHWNYIAIIFSSTCVYAAVALFLAVKMFQREDVLFRS